MVVKDWSYEEFPEYTGLPEGAVRLETTGSEMGTYYAHDVEYAVMDGISLKLQILMPLTRNAPEMRCPCIVYVQGSGWMEQDMYHSLGRIAKLAERGYVIALAQYRHAGQAGFPAQIQDARNAVRFMRKNAEIFHVIPEQIFLGGSSSGGHTAVFAAIAGPDEDPFFDRNIYPGVSAGVIGLLDYYGCVSVQMPDGFPTNTDSQENVADLEILLSHVSENDRQDLRARASAVNYLTPELGFPPIFIVHGTKDRIVNTMQSVEFYQKLKSCGKDARLYLLGGADHGGPEFWDKQVVDLADEFASYCLAKK